MESVLMDEILTLRGISKRFGGIHALKSVDVEFYKGCVTAICGENGAGKSTLVKIIIGAYFADEGSMYYRGEKTSFSNPLDSLRAGISIVHQEPAVFGNMSVLENLFMSSEPVNRAGSIDWTTMNTNGKEALDIVGLSADILSRNMNELALGTQQLVLIAKAVYNKCEVLILDEPTSILSQSETDRLFDIIRRLKQQGVCVLYISHRMQEIYEISDQIVVLKDGEVTGKFPTKEATDEKILKAMSGRTFSSKVYIEREQADEIVFSSSGLTNDKYFRDVDLHVRKGEILGMYGLVGAGRSEFARAVFGDLEIHAGTMQLNGKEIRYKHPSEAIDDGVFYLPEDRGDQGLFKLNSIKYNMTAPFLNVVSERLGFINKGKEKQTVTNFVKQYQIKIKDIDQNILALSGGNQQKVLFSRWLFQQPKLLILDEPSRGVDVGTKSEMHKYIMDLAISGISVLLITSDITELLMLSDRVVTMRQGKITGDLPRELATEEEVLKLAIGF